MKARQIALAAALAGAGALFLFGDNTPSSSIAEPVVRSAKPAAARAPTQAPALLSVRKRDAAAVDDAAVFASTSWTPVAPVVRTQSKPAESDPPPAPQAPALPYSYLGKAFSEGQWQVFLARGNQTYIAATQTILDNQYRVDAIAPPLMTLTYLPLNQAQQLQIGSAP